MSAALLSLVRRLALPRDAGAFRLWLALVVVVHHATRIEIGKAPVLVFFALSGYWVHQVWHKRYAQTRRPWLTFVVSRWWRVAPVLLLASGLSVGAHALAQDVDWGLIRASSGAQAISAVSVLGYAQLVTRPVGPAWSLDIEMQFYLLVPLLVILVRRVSPQLVLALGLASFLGAMVSGAGVTLPSFLLFFLCGMVAAEHEWRVPQGMADGGLALAVLAVAAALYIPQGNAFVTEGAADSAIFNVMLGLLVMPFALTTVRRPSDAFDRALGDQSYLVYMLHWPAIIMTRFVDFGSTPRALVAGLALASATLLCLAVWRWFDRPLDRCRAAWVKSRAAVPSLKRKKSDSAAIFA